MTREKFLERMKETLDILGVSAFLVLVFLFGVCFGLDIGAAG